jgi:hypothetical protein
MAPGTFPSLWPGEHLLVLDAGGGKREERKVVFTAGSTHRMRFDFTQAEGAEPVPPRRTASVSPAAERTPARSELPEIRRWTGFLTDEDCGATGGAQGLLHLRCAERCIREGKSPMLYARGRLYRLEGFERIEILRDEPLRFRAWLEGDTLHVVAPGTESLESDVKD